MDIFCLWVCRKVLKWASVFLNRWGIWMRFGEVCGSVFKIWSRPARFRQSARSDLKCVGRQQAPMCRPVLRVWVLWEPAPWGSPVWWSGCGRTDGLAVIF